MPTPPPKNPQTPHPPPPLTHCATLSRRSTPFPVPPPFEGEVRWGVGAPSRCHRSRRAPIVHTPPSFHHSCAPSVIPAQAGIQAAPSVASVQRYDSPPSPTGAPPDHRETRVFVSCVNSCLCGSDGRGEPPLRPFVVPRGLGRFAKFAAVRYTLQICQTCLSSQPRPSKHSPESLATASQAQTLIVLYSTQACTMALASRQSGRGCRGCSTAYNSVTAVRIAH